MPSFLPTQQSTGSQSGLLPPDLSLAERMELVRQLEEYERIATAVSSRSLLDYLALTVIDSRPEPRAFRLIGEDWQWAQARTLAPAIESIAGLNPGYGGQRRFWLEYPRGHDKSSGVGRILNWLLGFSRRQNLRIQVAAADRDQARQIGDFMTTELSLNPWLSARIKSSRNQLVSRVNGSTLDILAADAAGSFGAKPDLLFCDELTHWQKDDLWNALYSGMAKRLDSVTIITTNSGLKGTWQEGVLKMAKKFSWSWLVYQAPGPIASWMTKEAIEEIAAGLPKGVARRVLYNAWVDPGEENGFCTRSEAERCAAEGARLGLTRQDRADPRYDYCAAVDYGLVKDRTALVVCHYDETQRLVVDRMDVWQGQPGSPVHADDVQLWIEQQYAAFNCRFVLDPYQLQPVMQRLQHLPIEPFEYRGGRGNRDAASNLLNLIRSDRLAWYPGCGDLPTEDGPHTLADEMAELVVKPMPYGWRIDHEAGRHDDRVTALAMAALKLTELGPQATLASIDERFF